MAGKFIRTRKITSRRARDDRRTRPDFNELAKKFHSNLTQQIKSPQFDLDLSVKAVPKPKPKKATKPKREKLGKEIWNVGGLRAHKKRRSGLGNRFKIYITAPELRDKKNRINIGWVNPPIGLKPGQAEKYFAEVHKSTKPNKVNLDFRDVKADPRTGNLSVKSLGQTLDEIQPLAGVGTRAAARAGIVVDDAGRFRCPPGVPAANQFTDRVGSNCFNITPANKRKAIDEAIRKASGFLSDIQMISTLSPDGRGFNSSGQREIAIRNLGLPPEKTEELIKFAQQRENMIAKVQQIEDSAIEQIQKTEPGFTLKTRSADGLTFEDDPIKVMQSAILALQESNPDLDLSGILWTADGLTADMDSGVKLADAVQQHTRLVAGHIWDQLFGTVENGQMKPLSKAEEARKQKMINYALNFKANTGATFVKDHELFNRALNSYLSKQEGFMFSLLSMANEKPEVFKRYSTILAYSPLDPGFNENEATAWVDDAGNYTLFWNPLQMVVQSESFGRPLIRDGEIRVFEAAEDSKDATESAILEEISKAADEDSKRLAIAKLFGHRMGQLEAGQRYVGQMAEEFGGDRAHAMFVFNHELAHHLTFDIAADAIRKGQVDGISDDSFETIEGALNEILFAGDVAGVLPDIIESVKGQSTRDILNQLSETGIAGKMPMEYMDEVWAFSSIHNAFKNGGEDAVLDELANMEEVFGPEFAMKMTDLASDYIMSDSKEATDFMKEWRFQQQTLMAELMSELYAAREFGIVDRNDQRVINALRAIDVKEAEIAASEAASDIAKAVTDSINDERGFNSSRIKSILKRSDGSLGADNPGWLSGMTPRMMAMSVVPGDETQMRQLMGRSIFGTDFLNEKQIKHIDKGVKRLYGGWENIDFSPESVEKMRQNMEQAFIDFPEFAQVAQKFGSPAYITVNDMLDTIVGNDDAWGTAGFHNYITRAILINPGIAGTNGSGGAAISFSRTMSVPKQENGMWNSVTDAARDKTNLGFGTLAIHEYGHWLSRTLTMAGKGEERDIEKLKMAGLSDEMIKALGKEHAENGTFGIGSYSHLESMAKEVLGQKVKVDGKNYDSVFHDVFARSGGASSLASSMDLMDEPIVLTEYGIKGGAQESWAEGFTAVVTGANKRERIANDAMVKAVRDVIGGGSDSERSVFAGFNSRRDPSKPVRRADIKNKPVALWAERRKFDDDEMGALLEITKVNESLQKGDGHAASVILAAEAIDGSGADTLRSVVDQLEADSKIGEKRADEMRRLVELVAKPSGSKKGKDDFSEAFERAKPYADEISRPLGYGRRYTDGDIEKQKSVKRLVELSTSGETVNEALSATGFVPSRRSDVVDSIFTDRQRVLSQASEPERLAMRAVTSDISKTQVPLSLSEMQERIASSALARKLGNTEDTFDHELNNVIIPWHNLVRRTELGRPYRTQMTMRLSSGQETGLEEGDVIDIPRAFRSDVISGDSALDRSSSLQSPGTSNAKRKIVILANETDKGIPDTWGNDPERHSTAITMPPSKLMVEHIGEDGTLFVSIDEQNHVDPIHEISQHVEMASRTMPESRRAESEIIQRSARQHRAAPKRGFNSSTAKKETSKKRGFEKAKEDADGYTLERDVVLADRLQPPSERTSAVLSDIEKAGGQFLQPITQDFIDRERSKGTSLAGMNQSDDNNKIYHRRQMYKLFDAMRMKANGKEYFTDETIHADRFSRMEGMTEEQIATSDAFTRKNLAENQDSFNSLWDRIPQEVRDHINSRTNDELYEDLKTAATQFAEGIDRRVRVRIKPGYFSGFMDDGYYKTTHSDGVNSEHSDPFGRSNYEIQAGFSLDTPTDLRPASGYVMHRDVLRAMEQDVRKMKADDQYGPNTVMGEFAEWTGSPWEPGAGIYGGIEMILNEDVSHRTGMCFGDSLNGWASPAGINSTDPDQLLIALACPRGQRDGLVNEASLMLLHGYLAQDYKHATRSPMSPGGATYHEALIGGSFNASELAEVKIPDNYLQYSTLELRQEIYNNDFIDSLGLTDEEKDALAPVINHLINNPSESYYDRETYTAFNMPNTNYNLFLTQRNYRASMERLKRHGFNGKLTATNRNGVNIMDPEVYAGYEEGMELESLLRKRLAEDMRKALRDMMVRMKEKPSRVEGL